ncbi:thiol peroxidase-like [Ylistrum balloti]|uniref:thiol peroxidase-like n=1 Tax=Ylistrum balloti TaxID=509963 RepID=UPI002905A44E|nr:thiol peroxidase-like [Ylistrum balloti]
MSKITLKGNPINLSGTPPQVGNTAPDFSLVSSNLETISLSGLKGKKILNIFPSIDTGVCAASVRQFEKFATEETNNIIVLNISRDTPFALERFCGVEEIGKTMAASDIFHQFGKDYGIEITSSPLAHLLARTVICLDEDNRVIYVEQVPEITQEPDYEKALESLK